MKKIECKRCSQQSFLCSTGNHTKTPGRIHTGLEATFDAEWDCPTCHGTGVILVSFLDRIALAVYRRGREVNNKVNPR